MRQRTQTKRRAARAISVGGDDDTDDTDDREGGILPGSDGIGITYPPSIWPNENVRSTRVSAWEDGGQATETDRGTEMSLCGRKVVRVSVAR